MKKSKFAGLNAFGLVLLLKEKAKELGSQKALAKKLGVSQQHLCDVLQMRRMAGPKILNALDLEAITRYYPRSELP